MLTFLVYQNLKKDFLPSPIELEFILAGRKIYRKTDSFKWVASFFDCGIKHRS